MLNCMASIGSNATYGLSIGSATVISGEYDKIASSINGDSQGQSAEDLAKKKDDFIQYCIKNNVTNVDDFNHYKKMYCEKNGSACSDYKFSGYMEDRGCICSEELEALNSTGFKTKNQLLDAISDSIKSTLKGFGSKLSDSEIYSLVSKTNMADLAKYYNSCVKAPDGAELSTKDKIKNLTALGDLLGKFSQIEGISSDLKNKIEGLSNSVKNRIILLKEKLKKEEHEHPSISKKDETNETNESNNESTQATPVEQCTYVENASEEANQKADEETTAENLQKYKEALIANSYLF